MSESTAVATVPAPKPVLRAGGKPLAIVPQTMDEAFRMAQAIHQSGLQPKDMDTPQKVMVAILHGMEVGLPPMQSIQKIAVINGRPTIWGDASLALVEASGLSQYVKEWETGEGDTLTAHCETHRVGKPHPVVNTFSVSDAKTAMLWGKTGYNGKPTPWITNPKRMLKMRARGFTLRDVYSDVLGGLYIREEIEEGDFEVVATLPPPPPPPPPPKEVTHAPAPAPVPAEKPKQQDPAPAAASPVDAGPNEPDQPASAAGGPPVVQADNEVAPPTPDKPEEYRSWVMGMLLSFENEEAVDTWFENEVGSREGEMFPPDYDDLVELLNKRRADLESKRADG